MFRRMAALAHLGCRFPFQLLQGDYFCFVLVVLFLGLVFFLINPSYSCSFYINKNITKLFSSIKISNIFSHKTINPPALLAGAIPHLEVPASTPWTLGWVPPVQSSKSRLPEKPHLHILRKNCKVSTAKVFLGACPSWVDAYSCLLPVPSRCRCWWPLWEHFHKYGENQALQEQPSPLESGPENRSWESLCHVFSMTWRFLKDGPVWLQLRRSKCQG